MQITDISDDQANLATNVVETLKEMKVTIAELQKKVEGNRNDQAANKALTDKQMARRKRFNEAPVCKHCNRKHPSAPEDKCWELEQNAALRKPNWKSSKKVK